MYVKMTARDGDEATIFETAGPVTMGGKSTKAPPENRLWLEELGVEAHQSQVHVGEMDKEGWEDEEGIRNWYYSYAWWWVIHPSGLMEFHAIVTDHPIYLMGDDGKTIDRV